MTSLKPFVVCCLLVLVGSASAAVTGAAASKQVLLPGGTITFTVTGDSALGVNDAGQVTPAGSSTPVACTNPVRTTNVFKCDFVSTSGLALKTYIFEYTTDTTASPAVYTRYSSADFRLSRVTGIAYMTNTAIVAPAATVTVVVSATVAAGIGANDQGKVRLLPTTGDNSSPDSPTPVPFGKSGQTTGCVLNCAAVTYTVAAPSVPGVYTVQHTNTLTTETDDYIGVVLPTLKLTVTGPAKIVVSTGGLLLRTDEAVTVTVKGEGMLTSGTLARLVPINPKGTAIALAVTGTQLATSLTFTVTKVAVVGQYKVEFANQASSHQYVEVTSSLRIVISLVSGITTSTASVAVAGTITVVVNSATAVATKRLESGGKAQLTPIPKPNVNSPDTTTPLALIKGTTTTTSCASDCSVISYTVVAPDAPGVYIIEHSNVAATGTDLFLEISPLVRITIEGAATITVNAGGLLIGTTEALVVTVSGSALVLTATAQFLPVGGGTAVAMSLTGTASNTQITFSGTLSKAGAYNVQFSNVASSGTAVYKTVTPSLRIVSSKVTGITVAAKEVAFGGTNISVVVLGALISTSEVQLKPKTGAAIPLVIAKKLAAACTDACTSITYTAVTPDRPGIYSIEHSNVASSGTASYLDILPAEKITIKGAETLNATSSNVSPTDSISITVTGYFLISTSKVQLTPLTGDAIDMGTPTALPANCGTNCLTLTYSKMAPAGSYSVNFSNVAASGTAVYKKINANLRIVVSAASGITAAVKIYKQNATITVVVSGVLNSTSKAQLKPATGTPTAMVIDKKLATDCTNACTKITFTVAAPYAPAVYTIEFSGAAATGTALFLEVSPAVKITVTGAYNATTTTSIAAPDSTISVGFNGIMLLSTASAQLKSASGTTTAMTVGTLTPLLCTTQCTKTLFTVKAPNAPGVYTVEHSNTATGTAKIWLIPTPTLKITITGPTSVTATTVETGKPVSVTIGGINLLSTSRAQLKPATGDAIALTAGTLTPTACTAACTQIVFTIAKAPAAGKYSIQYNALATAGTFIAINASTTLTITAATTTTVAPKAGSATILASVVATFATVASILLA